MNLLAPTHLVFYNSSLKTKDRESIVPFCLSKFVGDKKRIYIFISAISSNLNGSLIKDLNIPKAVLPRPSNLMITQANHKIVHKCL